MRCNEHSYIKDWEGIGNNSMVCSLGLRKSVPFSCSASDFLCDKEQTFRAYLHVHFKVY